MWMSTLWLEYCDLLITICTLAWCKVTWKLTDLWQGLWIVEKRAPVGANKVIITKWLLITKICRSSGGKLTKYGDGPTHILYCNIISGCLIFTRIQTRYPPSPQTKPQEPNFYLTSGLWLSPCDIASHVKIILLTIIIIQIIIITIVLAKIIIIISHTPSPCHKNK